METPIIPFYKLSDKIIVTAKDCCQIDSDGKQYIDFESGDWAANLGHSSDNITQTITYQAANLVHDGLRFRNMQSEELSMKLTEKLLMPDGKSVFLNSGSEAVNLGITIARNLTQRDKILKMDCSFLASYGYGKMSAENDDLVSIPMNNTDVIDQLNFQEIAAFVFEPGNAHGMIKFPSEEFILKLSTAVKHSRGLLMANEVTTGFGRTGKWFGHHHYGFKPDIVSTGKGLGNGYPVSCVTISKEVAELFDKNPFRYAQSHQNDPLGCAVGLAVISTLEREGLIKKGFEKGEYFKIALLKLQKLHPDKILDVRGRGLMLAIEIEKEIMAEDLYRQLIEKGFLVGQKENVLRFMPPLIIEKEHIDQLINMLHNLLS